MMADERPTLNQQIVLSLLTEAVNPFGEEKFHPWQAEYYQFSQGPLLRIWDLFSGIRLVQDGRMMSKGTRYAPR